MDTTANMLTALVNAQRVGKERAALPYSKFSEQLLQLLQDKGMIASYRVQEGPISKLIVTLAYDDERPVLTGVRRVSSPGRKQYARVSSIPYSSRGGGFFVVSTSAGLRDDRAARKEKIGGEIVCEIW